MPFEWDAHNEWKPAAHQVTREEVEEAVLDPHAVALPGRVENGELRLRLIGATAAQRRLLVVVYVDKQNGVLRVVTAFPADPRWQRIYAQHLEAEQ